MLQKMLPLCLLALLMLVSLAFANPNAPLSGNPSSKIYHNSSCRYYKCKACTATFATRQDAQKQGYRPCKVCKG